MRFIFILLNLVGKLKRFSFVGRFTSLKDCFIFINRLYHDTSAPTITIEKRRKVTHTDLNLECCMLMSVVLSFLSLKLTAKFAGRMQPVWRVTHPILSNHSSKELGI